MAMYALLRIKKKKDQKEEEEGEDLMLTSQNWDAPKYQLISVSVAMILSKSAIQL